MDELQNAIAIAVVQEQINGIREQQKAHNAGTNRRLDKIDEQLTELVGAFNRGKGAYAASLFLAGAIGAAALKIAGILLSLFNK